jgi:mono/diheme cytochrome c family protein
MSICPLVWMAALPMVSAVIGCSEPAPAEFVVNLEGRDRSSVGRTRTEAITETLEALFGTPDEPRVPEGVTLDAELLRLAAGPVRRDEAGNPCGLFRQHCVACHGISGDGAGPDAARLAPYPRDYRRGLFKFTSTAGGAKPIETDLERTLRAGVPGTAMPSFAALEPRQLAALVAYVEYLSIRGEAELSLIRLVVDDDERLPLDMNVVVEECVRPVAEMWQQKAPQAAIPEQEALEHRPPIDTAQRLAASIARGRALYLRKDSQCIKCHGPEGDGQGEQPELYDDWNKPKKGVTPEQTAALAPLFTLPLQELKARDFREGKFRGGSRPVDLYWRIDVGLKGTAMPAAGPSPGVKGILTSEEIWDVVHYVRSLSGANDER